MEENFRAGFLNIIGRPNVGKSTLMNAVVGERMSIVTHKPQTTRHRILGILSEADYQIVFSDTPGYISKPSYKMHEAMNKFVTESFDDADVIIFLTSPDEVFTAEDPLVKFTKSADAKKVLVINKCDVFSPTKIKETENQHAEFIDFDNTFVISAMNKVGIDVLLEDLKSKLPVHPPYYPTDQLTDRTERFFCSEIIRENIFLLYRDEVPYASQVVIEGFKESEKHGKPFAHIDATIVVARETQKIILLGKDGNAIKQLGISSRRAIERFLGYKIFLGLSVKTRDNWHDDEKSLKVLGYS